MSCQPLSYTSILHCSTERKSYISRKLPLETYSLEKIADIFGNPSGHRCWDNPDFICNIEKLSLVFLVSSMRVKIIDCSVWQEISAHSMSLSRDQLILFNQLSSLCTLLLVKTIHNQ
jgi:hypothetical protein